MRDFTTLDDVRRDSESIRCGVSAQALDGCGGAPAPSQFPIGAGPKPSDAERSELVAWIDSGMPE